MENKLSQKTIKLVTGGVMIALSTVLSFIKVFELPYGGSITLLSMLPIMFYGFRYGAKWGLFVGFIHGALQLLFGADGLRGMDVLSLLGVVAFDYLIAFSMLGLAGILKSKIKSPSAAFTVGALIAGFLRYASHILAGMLFWGEYAEWYFSQEGFTFGAWVLEHMSGTLLAFVYSTVYNGMYMIPETIITAIGAFLLIKFAGNQILDKNSIPVKTA